MERGPKLCYKITDLLRILGGEPGDEALVNLTNYNDMQMRYNEANKI